MEILIIDHVLDMLICAVPQPISGQCIAASQHLPRNVGDVEKPSQRLLLQVDQAGFVNGIQGLVGEQSEKGLVVRSTNIL